MNGKIFLVIRRAVAFSLVFNHPWPF